MPCASAEKWYFDTYAPRLSFDVMRSWSIRQQVEAFDELDVIAATTADSVMRGACLGVLTSRPDIAVLSKLGCKEDGDEFLALFEDEYVGREAPRPAAPPRAEDFTTHLLAVSDCKVTYDETPSRAVDLAVEHLGKLAVLQAKYQRPARTIDSRAILNLLETHCSAGMSGAPIFDDKMEIVGVFYR